MLQTSLALLALIAGSSAAPLLGKRAGPFEIFQQYDSPNNHRTYTYAECVPAGSFSTILSENAGRTVERCINRCANEGHLACAINSAGECYIASYEADGSDMAKLRPKSTLPDSACQTGACPIDPKRACGGENMMIYSALPYPKLPITNTITTINDPPSTTAIPSSATIKTQNSADWTYTGCYTDSIGARSLVNPVSSSHWDIATCLTAVNNAGYRFGGVEYGGECWGANEIASTGQTQDASHCTKPCGANEKEECGGDNSIDIYTSTKPASSFVSSSSTATSTSSTSTSTAAATSTTLKSDSWTYSGCYTDSIKDRTLSTGVSAKEWTLDSCLSAVAKAGLRFGGVIVGGECWGSNKIASTSTKQSEDQCNWTCANNGGQLCGGASSLSVYESTLPASTFEPSSTVEPTPAPTAAPLTKFDSATWTYSGCYADSLDVRSLPNALSVPAWTTEACLIAATTAGFSIAAVEYGGECWAGNVLTSEKLDASACSMECNNKKGQSCGGSLALDVYTLNAVQSSSSSTTTTSTTTSTTTTTTSSTSPSPSPSPIEVETCRNVLGSFCRIPWSMPIPVPSCCPRGTTCTEISAPGSGLYAYQ